MSRIWHGTLACAAALLSATGAAGAADLISGGMKDYGYRPALAAPASWYLRLDGGYAIHGEPTITGAGTTFTRPGIGDTWSFGAGFGRYLSSHLRTDLTVDHRFEADAHGRNVAAGATFPGTHRFGFESSVLLANLYYDFKRGGGFNPYVGAGLGMANNQTSVGGTQTGGSIGEASNWGLAGALMAGFTVTLSQNLNFDAGYRFLYLGDTKTGDIRNAAGTVVSGPSVDDIHAHEFRFGLRWDVR